MCAFCIMMKQAKFNGKRLKEALQLRMKKMTELADETGISKQSLSLYANEGNMPPVENVFKIANALKLPYKFFMVEPMESFETGKIYFRSQASATKRARMAASRKMQYIAAIYEVLLKKINFPRINLPDENIASILDDIEAKNVNYEKKIEQLADEVRFYWGLGDGPIDNLQYVLESNGIIVTGVKDEDSHIDAYSQQLNVDGNKLFIVVLELGKKPLGRLRFDMAHELGHILMHRWNIETEEISKDEFNAMEKEANIFASAFLLPRKEFTKNILAYPTSLDYYRELKKKWRVSIQAMMYRTRQLNIISANQFQYMMRQVSKQGWRLKEPGDVPGQLRDNIFQGAIDLLLNGGYMSKGEIIALFEKSGIIFRREDLENLMCLRKGTLAEDAQQIQVAKISVRR